MNVFVLHYLLEIIKIKKLVITSKDKTSRKILNPQPKSSELVLLSNIMIRSWVRMKRIGERYKVQCYWDLLIVEDIMSSQNKANFFTQHRFQMCICIFQEHEAGTHELHSTC